MPICIKIHDIDSVTCCRHRQQRLSRFSPVPSSNLNDHIRVELHVFVDDGLDHGIPRLIIIHMSIEIQFYFACRSCFVLPVCPDGCSKAYQ